MGAAAAEPQAAKKYAFYIVIMLLWYIVHCGIFLVYYSAAVLHIFLLFASAS